MMSPDGSVDSKAIMNAVSLPSLQTSYTNSKPESSSSPTTRSTWHTIRPWTPALSLLVREITSVSATFILGSTLHINGQPNAQIDPSLASLALEAAATAAPDEEDDLESAHKDPRHVDLDDRNPLVVKPQVISREDNSSASSRSSAKDSARRRRKPTNSVVADALSKGLSVTVNGAAWPRAFIRINEELDEAVIIIYALMPGRQYDIDLELAPGVNVPSLHRQVTTVEDDSDDDSSEAHTDPESPSLENSTTSSDPLSTPSTSPSRTAPGTPPMPNGAVAATSAPPITLEERLSQLQHTLSQANAERESLLASLKSARRDSQKADSALRAEIDTLKRTSERNAAAELRGKQKMLALQEAVKRAQNSVRETEEMVKEVEQGLPELHQRKEKMEREYEITKAEANRVRKEREEKDEKERRDIEGLKSELCALTHKLERLGGKREKLEAFVLPDLDEKLKEVEKEIADEERDLQLWVEREEQRSKIAATLFGETSAPNPSFVPVQRARGLDGPGTINRPTPGPISRPSLPDGSTGSQNGPLWSPLQRQVQAHTHIPVQHISRVPSHSLPPHGLSPILLTNPTQRQSSLRSNGSISVLNASMNNSNSSFSSSISAPGILPSGVINGLTASPTSTSTNSSPISSHQNANVSSTSISSTNGAGSTLSSRAPVFEPSSKLTNGTSHSHFLSAHGPNNSFPPPLHHNVTNSSPTATHSLPAPIQRPRSLSTKAPAVTGTPGQHVPMRSPHAQTNASQGQHHQVQHAGVPVHSQRIHSHAAHQLQQPRER